VHSDQEGKNGRGTVAVVVMSHRGSAQIARLVSRLEGGGDVVVAIHHDPTGEPLSLRPSSAVALVPDPVPCPWGRLSRTEAIRRSLKWLRANVPTLSWALVISGQDYPIRTMASIEAELAAAPCDAFIRHFPLDGNPANDVHPWQTRTRERYYYRRRLPGTRRSVRLPWPRRLPFKDEVTLYAGEQYINVSAPAIDKLLDSPLREPLLRYLRWAPLPDEVAVVTMALNGKPDLTVVNDRKRYIRWPKPGNPHPAVISPEDLPELRTSSAFFARKVDLGAWPDVCDALDDLALDRDPPVTV
jgi:hypothetical protein